MSKYNTSLSNGVYSARVSRYLDNDDVEFHLEGYGCITGRFPHNQTNGLRNSILAIDSQLTVVVIDGEIKTIEPFEQ